MAFDSSGSGRRVSRSRFRPGIRTIPSKDPSPTSPAFCSLLEARRPRPRSSSPPNAYEGRLHARLRADALTRNLLELPHAGWAAGPRRLGGSPRRLAGLGRRTDGLPFAAADARAWTALSGFALAALPLPLGDGRHRVLGGVYAGTGSNLDRFSAFRLSGGSNAGDYETITRPVLPAAGLDEIVSRGYVIASLELRGAARVLPLPAPEGHARRGRQDRPGRGRHARPADGLPERRDDRPHERVLLVLRDRAFLVAQHRARAPERRTDSHPDETASTSRSPRPSDQLSVEERGA